VFDNWCPMVCSKCHYSAWLTSPIRQRRNLSLKRPLLRWTLHPSQPPSNSTQAICFQKTEETCHPICPTDSLYEYVVS
jgi:Fe-S-cluster-containing hydrogenase component 2